MPDIAEQLASEGVPNALDTFDDDGLQVVDPSSNALLGVRPVRSRNVMREMQLLTRAFVERPEALLKELVDIAVQLCGANSAGISLIRYGATEESFYKWVAPSGNYSAFFGAILPRFPSACNFTLELGAPSVAGKRAQSKGRIGSPALDRTTVLKRNNVRVLGHGSQTIVFAHGFGCDQEMWRSVAPAFLSDYTVVLFDHIGAGASNSASFDRIRHSTLQGYTQDVLDILEVLELQRVHFVGHSVSGMIGALASIANPELFASLVMVSSSPRYINDGEYIGGFEQHDIEGLLEVLSSNYLGWSMTMAPMFMGNEHIPELAKELELSFCRVDPVIAHHFAQVIFLSDFRAELPKIRTRTLILQPQEDIIVPVAVGEYLHRSVSTSRLVILDAKGHYPHLSAPSEVIQTVKQFLASTRSDP